MKKILEIVAYVAFALVFVWVSGNLFFEDEIDGLVAGVFGGNESFDYAQDLKILYPVEVANLEPTSLDPDLRQRLGNVYESLVFVDEDLNYQSSLALSWGLLEDDLWEFNLREGVKFHDGSDFDVDDVLASFDRAMGFSGSELLGELGTVENVKKLDQFTLRVKTFSPDPLLLSRLSKVFVLPEELANKEKVLVGTGPYRIVDWKVNEVMNFERFEEYWGGYPIFSKVDFLFGDGKFDRVNRFLEGEADFLSFVPFDAVDVLNERGFAMEEVPSLEVQFLMFNFESDFFESEEAREVLALVIDKESLFAELGSAVKNVDQFVSSGVFGFNPDVVTRVYDLERAKVLVEKFDLAGKTVKFHLPIGLDVLGEHVRVQMSKVGVNVIVSYLDGVRFGESLEEGEADVYFLGFKSDSGDAGAFLNEVVHSEAEFNYGDYESERVDELIETGREEMDPVERLADLQEAMGLAVDDLFAVPLFEYQLVYALAEGVDFKPRIDGFVRFNDLKKI